MIKFKHIWVFSLLSFSFGCFATQVDISGIDKIVLLQKLFERAKPQQGCCSQLSYSLEEGARRLSDSCAKQILQRGERIDYIRGRTIKIYFSEDYIDTWAYNRDNGENAAEEVIASLKSSHL